MILTELTGYKHIVNTKTLDQLLQFISQNTNASIKNGNFAMVLIPPDTDYVYKIWIHDPAFESYYDICRNTQSDSLMRIIKNKISNIPLRTIRDLSDKDTKIKVAVLPKMREPTPSEFTDYFGEWYNQNMLKEMCLQYTYYTNFDFDDDNQITAKGKEFIEGIPFDKFKYNLDINSENMMIDLKTNKLVLSDPMFSRNAIGISTILDKELQGITTGFVKMKALPITGKGSAADTDIVSTEDQQLTSDHYDAILKTPVDAIKQIKLPFRKQLFLKLITDVIKYRHTFDNSALGRSTAKLYKTFDDSDLLDISTNKQVLDKIQELADTI